MIRAAASTQTFDIFFSRMKKLLAAFVLLLVVGYVSRNLIFAQTAIPPDWRIMALRDEEFSVLVPMEPSILVEPDGYKFSQSGETVLGHRAYSGYADGFIFVIESYKATRPQRLLKDIDGMFRNMERVQLEASADARLSSFATEKYSIGRNNFAGYIYVLVTSKHLYTVTVAAKTKVHPDFGRFLSSFDIGNNGGIVGGVIPRRQTESVTTVQPPDIVNTKESTRKAIVVWKPEPAYTESARMNQRTGTVVLKGTFTSSGQVIITAVIKGLNDGLTERAIEAAKNIKFFPAEKDSKPVSVSLQLEYNFNLY